MKLIKLTTDHYVIVDDSKIKEGDWFLPISGTGWELNKPRQADDSGAYNNDHCKKITHSTQPLEYSWDKLKQISLSKVKELLGEVDVEKKADEFLTNELQVASSSVNRQVKVGFEAGYNQALEDNKDKKYTNEDMLTIRNQLVTILPVGDVNAWDMIQAVSKYIKWLDEYVESIHQSSTSWEVKFVGGKLKLK